MSYTQQPPTTLSIEPAAPSWLRLFRFPLIVVIVFGAIFAIPFVCVAFDLGSEELTPFFMIAIYPVPILAMLLIGLWWIFFFRGLYWPARLGVAMGLVMAVGTAVGSTAFLTVREVEFTMSPVGLVPRFHFVWEITAKDKLAQKLQADTANPGDMTTIDATVGPTDFPAYRGRNTDGIVAFAKLQTDWQKNSPSVVWRNPCPGGYSGVAVAGNIVVTLQQHDDTKQEVVVCYDRATGKHRWFYHYDAYYIDNNRMGNGPRSTPTIHDNHIYSIGATGELICLTVEGKKKWSHNILELAKAKNIKWGLTGSPLIVGDLVIAHAGIDPDAPNDSALIAFERTTGKIRWQVGRRPAGYSSPQLATLGGVPQILLFDGDGLVSYDPKTSKELWQHPWVTKFEMNNIQPVVIGSDRVFISSEIDNGAALLRVTAPANDKAAWTVEEAWKNKNLAARFANPVTDGKHLFGLHNLGGVLTCLNVSDGSIAWKGERCGPGQLLLADGVLVVVHGDTGEVMLYEPSGDRKELARGSFLESKDKTWNTPALAGDQLFIRNQAEIVCVKLPTR